VILGTGKEPEVVGGLVGQNGSEWSESLCCGGFGLLLFFGLSRMKKMGTALLVSQPFWQLLKGATGKDKL